MIGQAGVFRVASRLLMLGHVPSFPSVDTGVDIILDNGLRLQVKSSHLRHHKGYPFGAYCFSAEDNNFGNRKRDWTKVCDFLCFWGIDEDRFFVVSAADVPRNFWVQPKQGNSTVKGKSHLVHEDQWELLNINSALASIEAASAETSMV